jgi:glycosyltransferase involved in cell wall biosynthesis
MKEKMHSAPRPLRFYAHCVSQNYSVRVSCAVSKGIDNAPLVPIAEISNVVLNKYQRMVIKMLRLIVPFGLVKNWLNEILYDFQRLRRHLNSHSYDLIYVADLHMLPLIISTKGNSKLIFDAREYYPLQYEDNFNFNFFDKPESIRILKNVLAKCDKVITVSQGLANAYSQNFGVKSELILSLPNFQELPISNKSEQTIKILYHGMANRNRKIENFIEILNYLTIDAELHLYLLGDRAYINELEKEAKYNCNVFFHEPVAYKDIISTVNRYDIGICYYEPTSFNLRHCLPNKFFEYMQARLVLAIGPSPDMSEIVMKFECGVISKDFTVRSLANELNALTRERINSLKQKSELAAKHYCFENEEEKLRSITSNLLNIN